MAAHDLNIRTNLDAFWYNMFSKDPYFRTAGQDLYVVRSGDPYVEDWRSYVKNSLEGTLFDDTLGVVTLPIGTFHPNFYYSTSLPSIRGNVTVTLSASSGPFTSGERIYLQEAPASKAWGWTASTSSPLTISGWIGRLPTVGETLVGENSTSTGTVSTASYVSPLVSIARANNLVTVTVTGTVDAALVKGDYVSIFGINPATAGLRGELFNGVYKVYSIPTNSTFTFFKNGPDISPAVSMNNSSSYSRLPAVSIFDNRPAVAAPGPDSSGRSYYSVLLAGKQYSTCNNTEKKITPHDMYMRFRINNADDTSGGINPNVFSVIDQTTGLNIKPVLWSWFFGGLTKVISSDFSSADRTPNNTFDIIFNSYAVVLRPTGDGSYLEFALVKFNWGEIQAAQWFSTFINSALLKQYTVSDVDLGYLIASNPETAKISNVSMITEIAKSSQFLYEAEKPFEVNLKLSVRKHVLTDSSEDNTYYVQLALNSDYNSFGNANQYSTIMHAFIRRPTLQSGLSYITQTATESSQENYRLIPWTYFKFINANPTGYGALNSSKIIMDNFIYRMMNASDSRNY